MRGNNRTKLAVGLMILGGLCATAQKLTAQEKDLNFVVYVNNYAGIDSKTLVDAEKVATVIFHKSGVEAHWLTNLETSGENIQENSAGESNGLPQFYVNVLPRVMSDRWGLPAQIMGFAPGSECNRKLVYVLYDRVEALANSPTNRFFAGPQYYHVTSALVLGHAIAHEIGHVLLNLQSHTAIGIMRGNWTTNDLRDALSGRLIFTNGQAEVIRAEVARRMSQQDTARTAGIEVASAAH